MKTVFTSREIAHVWAHQSAPHGKSPGAVSFNGPVIYSYSTAMARFIEHKGKRAIILNVTSYSVSTSKHQGRINSAIYGLDIPVFRVNGRQRGTDLRFYGSELFTYYIESAAKQEVQSLLPRIRQTTRDSHKAQASAFLEQAKAVAAFYGLRKKVDEKAVQRLATAKARAEKRERIAQEKREAAYRAEQLADYEAWKRGEVGHLSFTAGYFPVAFRVEGDELVSTLGARVPLRAAQVAYRFAMRVREAWAKCPKCGNESVNTTCPKCVVRQNKIAPAWHENGETCEVGHYRLNAINEHGIVAGCHRITWAELERLAPVLSGETVNA